jgi:YVTN family beta-propeller protein
MFRRISILALSITLAPQAAAAEVDTRTAPFVTFESGPVDSLLLTRDGSRLLVLNTSDHRLEVFALPKAAGKLTPTKPPGIGAGAGGAASGSPPTATPISATAPLLRFEVAIFTGLEPVAMALHPTDDDIVFVVNHVSDTVSVVDLSFSSVVATIQVGDEPQGIAIASDKLFVACARTPQTPLAPGAILPGPQVENVIAVAQANPPYAFVASIALDNMKPRALAAANGVVYAAAQNSGNHTTLLNETKTKQLGLAQSVADAYDAPFDVNPVLLRPEINPGTFHRGWYLPNAGRIVFDFEYPTLVPQLADRDVFAIDAATATKLPFAATGVGTTLYGAAINPATGALWVTNTDADNRTRFEPTLVGGALENRITIVDPSGGPHRNLDLEPPFTPEPFALPGAIEFSTGPRPLAFVAAQSSAAVLVLDAVSGSFKKAIATGTLPSGLEVDAARSLLFVHSRGEHTIRAFDLTRFTPVGAPTRLSYDPEPPLVRTGRLHLYEAREDYGHGNGTMSCASCHVFGHGDALAWDLGDPGGAWSYFYPDILQGIGSFPGDVVASPNTPTNHPLKGPMVTQSLRGLMDPDAKDDLPLHWRGDRRTFHQFRTAFQNLLGGDGVPPIATQEFARFLRAMRYAPNPLGPRDRVYQGAEGAGADKFGMNLAFSGKDYSAAVGVSCIDCHNGDFFGKDDFTGSRPVSSAGSFTQLFQTAQLRMAYEKHSPEITGFGLLHDGAVDGVRGFMDFIVPNNTIATFNNLTTQDKDEIAAFVESWDHGLSPLVGAQFTLDTTTLAAAPLFLDLAEAQAKAPLSNVDLIVKGYRVAPDGTILHRGALFEWSATQQAWGYQFDTGDFVDRSVVLLVAQLGVAKFTFTCVAPGQGVRLGIDRDEDGALDFVEATKHSDPTRADSDGDGYADGFELASGSNPTVADVALADSAAPSITTLRALEIGSELATIEVVTNEPASLAVTVGTSSGAADVATITATALRRRHDLVFGDLPSGVALHVSATATDKNGNAASAAASFDTLPPFLHLDSITLEKSGSSPYSVAAKIRVVDRKGQAVSSVPLTVFFAGDLGGQSWQRTGITAADGVATIQLQPFTPSAPTEVAVCVAWVGSLDPQNPWFVGVGGSTPGFYYDQTENRANHARISVP